MIMNLDVTKKFLTLSKTSKIILSDLGISTFTELLNKKDFVRDVLNSLNRNRTNDCILKIINEIEPQKQVKPIEITDPLCNAAVLYLKLSLRAKQILKNYNISTFEDLANQTEFVKAFIQKLTRVEIRIEIFKIIELIERSQTKSIAEIKNKIPDESEEETLAIKSGILDLPLILFSDLFEMKILRSLLSQQYYMIRDIYNNRFTSDYAYISWNKILEQNNKVDLFKYGLENKASIGLQRFLQFNKISSINELEKYINSYESFRVLPLSNRNLLNEIKSLLINQQGNKNLIKEFGNKDLIGKLEILLNKIKLIDRGVFWARYIENQTLEAIGQQLSLTRERVRQIEEKMTLILKPVFNRLLINEIDKVPSLKMIINTKPILLPEQTHLIRFLGINELKSLSIFKLSDYLDIIEFVEQDYILVRKDFAFIPFQEISKKVKQYRRENISFNSKTEDYQRIYYRLVAEGVITQDTKIREYIINYISLLWEIRYILIKDEKKVYVKQNKISNSEIIETILKQNGPLHYSEVEKILNNDYKLKTKKRNIHATLSRPTGKFVNIGKGIYDVKSSKYSGKKVFNLIYDLLENKQTPQSLKEIEEYILSKKKVDRLTVRATIDMKKEFIKRTYDGKYGLANWTFVNYPIKIYHRSSKYSIILENAFTILLESGKLDKPFTFDDYINLLSVNFGDKTSNKRKTIYLFLYFLIKKNKLFKLNNKYHVKH